MEICSRQNKNNPTLSVFKSGIKAGTTGNCSRRLSKTFFKDLGFVEVAQTSNGIRTNYL